MILKFPRGSALQQYGDDLFAMLLKLPKRKTVSTC